MQLYSKVGDDWRVAASLWTIAIPNERSIQMANALPESAPIPDRIDEGCELVARDVAGLRSDEMPPAERILGSISMGTAPEEVASFTQEQYDAISAAIGSDAVNSSGGAGGVLAQRVGDLCFGVTAMNRTFEHEGTPTTLRLRAFVVSNLQLQKHVGSFSVVLPLQRPAEEAAPEEAEAIGGATETQSSP